MSPEFVATYRVQLRPEFGFAQAGALADYLAALGVSHLYTSPVLQATPGSTHGYDVVDHSQVSGELGGIDGLTKLWQALKGHGMGHVLDLVPNHMAVAGRNRWWWDVLENGLSSLYAAYFDIDWQSPDGTARSPLAIPMLADHYGRILEAGKIRLAREGGSFILHYENDLLPVAPRSLSSLLATASQRCDSDQLLFIADSLERLPLPTDVDYESVSRRHREKEVLRRLLARLCEEQPAVSAAIDQSVAEVNGDSAALDAFLERQNFRLVYWRTAQHELRYRRFFDVNTLVGLRVEEPRVFADTHRLVFEWINRGMVDGLRIDHPDGLRDPEGYFQSVRQIAPEAWIVAEKILMPGETLSPSWPLAGTAGYDFLNLVNGLFVDAAGEEPLTNLYAKFTGEPTDFANVAKEAKHLVLRELLASDVERGVTLWKAVCERHPKHRDYTRQELSEALCEVIACLPVYRTYIRAEAGQVGEEDVRYLLEAVGAAKASRPEVDGELLDFLRDILLLRIRGELETELVMRLQQLTGPVMAKGVEDTAFYRFNRLVSLNEVGGNPGRFGISVEEFHAACANFQKNWPRTMLATSTHDTKRSEDVRARINLLSEMPDRWRRAVLRWSRLNEAHRRNGLPDRNIEFFIYQTLVGAWPISVERATAYLEKAAREAKSFTSWTISDPQYEDLLRGFVQGVISDREFCGDMEAFVAPLVRLGWINSLAQMLLKLTAPGIPDIYQGTELWDLSLVDPDNRRPVDYDARRRQLGELDQTAPEEIWERAAEGLPKLWVTRQALRLRKKRPGAFGPKSSYRPITPKGRRAAHFIAFSRGEEILTVVPRLVLTLGSHWADTAVELPEGSWRNELTDESYPGGLVPLAKLLKGFPVALLSKQGGGL